VGPLSADLVGSMQARPAKRHRPIGPPDRTRARAALPGFSTRRPRAHWLAVLLGLAVALPAGAVRRCGDDVDGGPVPCACGDLLASSHTLGPADFPPGDGPCPGNGLLVSTSGAITLRLNGRTITGTGHGVGVLVLGGGSLALDGPGRIEGFESGVVARGKSALASVVGVELVANRLDGLWAMGDGYSIQGVVAEGNGRDGFALGGGAFALDANRAVHNMRWGFNVHGIGAHVGGGLGNEAVGNMMGGFHLMGTMHQVVGVTALDNHGDGFFASARQAVFSGIRADRNVGDGVQIMGMTLAVGETTATDNRGFGVSVNGADLQDRGGNSGSGNAGLSGMTEIPSVMLSETLGPLVQCRIGATTACR